MAGSRLSHLLVLSAGVVSDTLGGVSRSRCRRTRSLARPADEPGDVRPGRLGAGLVPSLLVHNLVLVTLVSDGLVLLPGADQLGAWAVCRWNRPGPAGVASSLMNTGFGVAPSCSRSSFGFLINQHRNWQCLRAVGVCCWRWGRCWRCRPPTAGPGGRRSAPRPDQGRAPALITMSLVTRPASAQAGEPATRRGRGRHRPDLADHAAVGRASAATSGCPPAAGCHRDRADPAHGPAGAAAAGAARPGHHAGPGAGPHGFAELSRARRRRAGVTRGGARRCETRAPAARATAARLRRRRRRPARADPGDRGAGHRSRVYLIGYSNGGRLALTAACALPRLPTSPRRDGPRAAPRACPHCRAHRYATSTRTQRRVRSRRARAATAPAGARRSPGARLSYVATATVTWNALPGRRPGRAAPRATLPAPGRSARTPPPASSSGASSPAARPDPRPQTRQPALAEGPWARPSRSAWRDWVAPWAARLPSSGSWAGSGASPRPRSRSSRSAHSSSGSIDQATVVDARVHVAELGEPLRHGVDGELARVGVRHLVPGDRSRHRARPARRAASTRSGSCGPGRSGCSRRRPARRAPPSTTRW